MPKRMTSFVSTTRSSVRLDTVTPRMLMARNTTITAIEKQSRDRSARVDRVGRVTPEGERVHGHRDHVAEHQQPQQEPGELRVALLAQVVERARPNGRPGR